MEARKVILLGSLGAIAAAVYYSTRAEAAALPTVEGTGDQGGGAVAGGDDEGERWNGTWPGYPSSAPDLASDEGEVAPDTGALDAYLLPVAYKLGNVFFDAAGLRSRISLAGVAEIARYEAFRSAPYQDAAGNWTIGYGHKIVGAEWWSSMSHDDALALLTRDVGIAEDAVNALVKGGLQQPAFDALVSLTFNIGAGAFRRSTLLRLLNAGDAAGAAAQFLVWNKVRSGGALVVSQGLANRRLAESRLFSQGFA